MPYLYEFDKETIFRNVLETSPETELSMYSGTIYLNNRNHEGRNIPTGSIDLYEYNVDRSDSQLIYPFIVKNSSLWTFKSITTASFNASQYGTVLTGAYPYTASIDRQYISSVTSVPNPNSTDAAKSVYFANRKRMLALQNTLNFYQPLSPNYKSTYGTGTFASGTVNLISIPSIFYGNSIKKGSINLGFYFTGTLIDEAKDLKQNGELISTMGLTSGSRVGMVLYNEGFVFLTNESDISDNVDDYTGAGPGSEQKASWQYFGSYLPGTSGNMPTGSLFTMTFKGVHEVPTVTMFANAQPGHLNNSNNPTWVSSSTKTWRNTKVFYDSGTFAEPFQLDIKNTVQSDYCEFEDEFQKQTFISRIGIFDKENNLLGIAKLANPVLKKEIDDYTFKLKLDL
jgi:hypothetical protein